MSGITGVAQPGQQAMVQSMLETIAHRGPAGSQIIEGKNYTLAVTWTQSQTSAKEHLLKSHTAWDEAGEGRFSMVKGGNLLLKRDPLGVAPLYYGWNADGSLCFASEVKGLINITSEIHELPPGHTFDGQKIHKYFDLTKLPPLTDSPEQVAKDLRQRLEIAVEKRAGHGPVGAWLSGGLDSSLLAALARRHFQPLHTFTAGLPGAPDVINAHLVAEYIKSKHHQLTVQARDLLAVLPEVIYHLESFDAWLVRSSILNYLVARLASGYVPAVFSGEGGDELFAGYAYLKSLQPRQLPDELIDITARLHNTALQRVDRCAAAHGTLAHVVFLDPEIVDYALRIPAEYKLRAGVEKWILRQAVADLLPTAIVERPKAKFWEGAGVQDLLAEYAGRQISDRDFANQRTLPNGWQLNSKEELLYYKIFCQHFGELENLAWMGRTKGTPIQ